MVQWQYVAYRERVDSQWPKVNQGIPVAEGGVLVSNKNSVKR